MQNSSFKTLHTSIRPARVAILIDRTDTDWQHTCLRVIEFYSQVWGGAHNIIVPTDGATIDERFWTLLEAFDPDYILQYRKSWLDISISDPQRYERILQQNTDAFLAHAASSDHASVRAHLDEHLKHEWASTFDIGHALQEELKIRLSPFWFQRWVVEAGAISAASSPPFHLTSLIKIIPNTEHPDQVTVIDTTGDQLPKLWYSAVTGLLREDSLQELERAGLKPLRYVIRVEQIDHLIDFTVLGSMQQPRPSRQHREDVPDFEVTPFRLSMLQLGLYRSLRYRHWQEPAIIVAGNTLDDFCLYYCLSRLRDRVTWMLPSVTEKALGNDPTHALSQTETSFLFKLRLLSMPSQQEDGLAVISYSLDPAQLDPVINQLESIGIPQQFQVTKPTDVRPLVTFPLFAVERDNFQRDISLQFSDDTSVSTLATPKPKHFHPIHPYEHRYITQLSIAGNAPPKHPELGAQTLRDTNLTTGELRVGNEGPAYFCPNIAYFGGDIDTVLVRPRLYLPPLQKVLEQLAATQGYDARPSDKGIYAEDTISKWGGLEEIGKFLRQPHNRALMDRYLDQSRSEAGKGVYLRDDRRRYLDFITIRSIVGDEASTLIDTLIEKQILHRGFIFRCSYCRNADWFSVSDITEEFKCRRCGRSQLYRKSNWRTPDEPSWFYKLDELVYQGYRQDMAVPILALDHLRATATGNFSFTTDREFWKPASPQPEIEVDFFCVLDGILTAGEAKRENSLGKNSSEENEKINGYVHLVKALCIRCVIFATESESWRSQTIEAVSSAFRRVQGVRLLFLDKSQLS